MRVFDFFWLGRVCLSCKLFWPGIIRQYCREFTAVTYHIPAPIGIGPGRTAFGLASKKVNELSDYGKVVLFNDGYALNDTADVFQDWYRYWCTVVISLAVEAKSAIRIWAYCWFFSRTATGGYQFECATGKESGFARILYWILFMGHSPGKSWIGGFLIFMRKNPSVEHHWIN